MVYAGDVGERRFTLGVSGRLLDENLVMWDEETGSLWSQILGEALQGNAKGTRLDMLPAVFVGLGTWRRMHPDTHVLDLSTVRVKDWYFTSEDLARGTVSERRGELDLGIGLRQGEHTLAVALPLLHQKKLLEVDLDGVPLALVWDEREHAALAYDRRLGDRTISLTLTDRTLQEVDGEGRWDVLSGQPANGDTAALPRFPYLPTYLRAWRTYYPDGEIRSE